MPAALLLLYGLVAHYCLDRSSAFFHLQYLQFDMEVAYRTACWEYHTALDHRHAQS